MPLFQFENKFSILNKGYSNSYGLFFRSLIIILLTYLSFSCLAADKPIFDLPAANENLTIVKKALEQKYSRVPALKYLKQKLKSDLDNGMDCVSRQKKKFERINQSLKIIQSKDGIILAPEGSASGSGEGVSKGTASIGNSSTNTTETPANFIQEKLTKVKERLAECTLYTLKADELHDKLNDFIIDKIKSTTWKKSDYFASVLSAPHTYLSELHFSARDSFNPISYGILAFVLLIVVYSLVGYALKQKCIQNFIDDIQLSEKFVKHSLLLFAAVFLSMFLVSINDINLYAESAQASVLLGSINQLVCFFATILLFQYFFRQNPYYNKKSLNTIVSSILVFVLIGSATLSYVGYPALAHYISLSILKTCIYTVLMVFLWLISKKISEALHNWLCPFQQQEEDGAEVIEHQIPLEFKVMRITMQLYILLTWLSFCLVTWELYLSETNFDSDWLSSDMMIFNISFNPYSLLYAGGLFTTILIAIRIFMLCFKVKMNVILFNFAYIVAGLAALYAAGVNLTGIAVIAGALSVGIGMGLKGVVNNFVSGLILLVEKPMKPGDRIIINGIEGYVKNIGLRATEVQALNQTDVIIPNEKFITSELTNYMLNELSSINNIAVGIAYDADVELASKILVELAQKHPHIVKKSSVKPWVSFASYDSSSITLKLIYTIKHPQYMFRTKSELQAQIFEAFNEYGIEFPFPQMDIHVKDMPK